MVAVGTGFAVDAVVAAGVGSSPPVTSLADVLGDRGGRGDECA